MQNTLDLVLSLKWSSVLSKRKTMQHRMSHNVLIGKSAIKLYVLEVKTGIGNPVNDHVPICGITTNSEINLDVML